MRNHFKEKVLRNDNETQKLEPLRRGIVDLGIVPEGRGPPDLTLLVFKKVLL